MPEPERRKRPPTFQHYPANRAIKLKQTWVQNTKLKSKWKAEKRKLGLNVPRTKPVVEEDTKADDEEPESSTAPAEDPAPPPRKRARRADPEPDRSPPEPAGPSLRDRAREAYSQASLHTYRSDPFGKRQRGGKSGATGRGQPNMKKRMDVLLETIKRNYT